MATATLTPTATRVRKIDGGGTLTVQNNTSLQAGITWQGAAWSVMRFALPADFLNSTITQAQLSFTASVYSDGMEHVQTKVGIPANNTSFESQDGDLANLGVATFTKQIASRFLADYYGVASTHNYVIEATPTLLQIDLLAAFQHAASNARFSDGFAQLVWQRDFPLFDSGESYHLEAAGPVSLFLDYTPVPLRLSIPTGVRVGESITGTAIRSGSTTSDLVVTLSQSPTGRVTMPATVTILAGQASATFNVQGATAGSVELTGTAGSDSWTSTSNVLPNSVDGFPANTTGLISAWQLNEAIGAALDAWGTNNLSDNNTVSSGTGIFGGCRSFTAVNSEYFSIPSNAQLTVGNEDFTFSGWVRFASQPAAGSEFDLISKYETSTNNREYRLHYVNIGGTFSLRWSLCGNGACTISTQPTRTGQLASGQWHHIACWYDAVNDVAGLQVNGEAPITTSYSNGVFQGNSPFHLGSLGRAAPTFFLNGSLDRVGFWKRVLTADERRILSSPVFPPPVGLGDEFVWYCPTFEPSASGTELTDVSGARRTGALTNFALSGATSNRVSDTGNGGLMALACDGNNDYVVGPVLTGIGSQNRSVAAWINFSELPTGTQRIITLAADLNATTDTPALTMYAGNSAGNFIVGAGLGGSPFNGYFNHTPTYAVNNWIHIAATVTGNTLNFFVNGTNVATRTNTGTVAVNPRLVVGAYNASIGQFLRGRIDDVRVFARAISASEVAHLATSRAAVGAPLLGSGIRIHRHLINRSRINAGLIR
jgi:hypothetical protein